MRENHGACGRVDGVSNAPERVRGESAHGLEINRGDQRRWRLDRRDL